jgi:hypothetical protein
VVAVCQLVGVERILVEAAQEVIFELRHGVLLFVPLAWWAV